ncbi:glycosyltransferase family 4 protein [Desulfobulbus oligotrophicus]|uniref:Glycosyltransferase family 4 protein n=1 Tax=Desulfobulbus oligotrophicus TaxID=1909699 RepID=A0A7T6ARF1_9BACT|nr:glycosyltransferase family 4 protein [Desulfobulbus oligotrophicus]QQG66487.1 glycosyltransferase family 4 protein [Desulfobulbus oligotrophicus]
MKIILTAHQFLPEYNFGTEVLTYSVAKDLVERGHEVSVLTGAPAKTSLNDDERFDEYQIDGINVYRFTHEFIPMGDQNVIMEIEYTNNLVARYFRKLLNNVKPDLVHIFHMSRLSAAIIDVTVNMNIPTYFTPTDFWSVCPMSLLMLDDGTSCKGPEKLATNCVRHVAMRSRWGWVEKFAKAAPDSLANLAVAIVRKGWLPRQLPFVNEISALSKRSNYLISRLNTLNGIVSPTTVMTEVLVRNGVRPELIKQYMYGINMDNYEARLRSRTAGTAYTFGFIGGLSNHKGCHVLIQAVRLLNHKDVLLKIYGNPKDFPDYYNKLQELAEDFPSIKFCGTFPNTQIAEILDGIDTLVVPSIWFENAPLVIHSALAAGCPVVSSDFPGMSEVIHNEKNGLLFEPGNAKDLAAKLRRLLDEHNLLEKLSSNCRKPKSIAEYVDEILTLYESRLAYTSN